MGFLGMTGAGSRNHVAECQRFVRLELDSFEFQRGAASPLSSRKPLLLPWPKAHLKPEAERWKFARIHPPRQPCLKGLEKPESDRNGFRVDVSLR
jgi:hypothetical protein